MNKLSAPVCLLHSLCCALALAAFAASAGQEVAAANTASPVNERAYKDAIARIESTQGAYGAGLGEVLLGMALALQSQGRHEEAISVFKRGIHLTRVNEGLYSTAQVPLLQGEIASHIAARNYALADERHRYLYRVQTHGITSGHALTAAFLQQAHWQYEAYQLGLGDQGYNRLMNMWDLYRLALNDVIAREGENSPDLLTPLHGMLQAQYLISNYQWQESDQGSGDDVRARQNLHRFTAYQAQSYQKGNAVIAAIHGIEEKRTGAELAAAQATVMMGDWRLWHGDYDAAVEAYSEAQTELAQQDDAQTYIARIFGEPVVLPDIDGLRPLPPITAPERADILLEFGVNERGRVINLERLDENEEQDGRAIRLMKKLRKTKFRPRFEAGQAVETEKVVKAFSIQ
jgi:hypothetical protein